MQNRNTHQNNPSNTSVERNQAELPFIELAEAQASNLNPSGTHPKLSSALPWYRNSLTLALITILIGLHVIMVMFYFAGEMEVKQTLVILQHDSCAFLQQKGVTLQPLENGTCKTEVRFRQNLIGTGGRVFIGDSVIKIADHQIIGVAALEAQPYSPEQRQALMLFIGSLLILLFFLGWTIQAHQNQPEEDAE